MNRVRPTVLLIVTAFALVGDVTAQATDHVPVEHPAYRELDVLRAAGLLPEVIVGQRPYPRLEFARLTKGARARVGAVTSPEGWDPELTPREWEALSLLETWFWEEIRCLTSAQDREAGNHGTCESRGVLIRPRLVRADLTQLVSPWREVPTLYSLPSDNVDARLNPLVHGHLGRTYVDGWTGGVEAGLGARLGRHVTVYAHPRLSLRDPRGSSSDTELSAHQLYLRSVVGNLAVEVGRDHLVPGQGFEAGTLVSRNPRGFDMIRLSNERPLRLPWLLEALGPTSASILAADLGSNRDLEHALLFLIRGSIRPHPGLEIGLSNLNVQGGKGAPTGDLWDRVKDVLLPGVDLPTFSEKLVGVDARVTLPDPGVELYMELANTDPDFRRFTQAMTHEAAWILGAAMPSFGPGGRLAARAEWRRNGFRPYTHHQYTSGLTLDGLVIGSPMGPAATAVAGQIGWSGAVHQFILDAGWERYGGDTYANIPDPDTGRLSWEKTADNPDEVRYRLEGEWTRRSATEPFRPSVRLGWESVDRFAFGDEGRTNWMAAVSLEYHW